MEFHHAIGKLGSFLARNHASNMHRIGWLVAVAVVVAVDFNEFGMPIVIALRISQMKSQTLF